MSQLPSALPPLSAAAAEWLAGLRQFVVEQRRQRPPEKQPSPLRPPPTAAESATEEQLIAEHLRHWLTTLPQLIAEGWQPNASRPAIAITTSVAGLRAVAGLATEPALAAVLSGCCAVTETEYRFWCKQQPDPDWAVHWNGWAWIKTRVPAARAAEFAAYPLAAGSRHWLFRHGLAAGGPVAHHSCRLYCWDGQSATLLADSFREGVTGL